MVQLAIWLIAAAVVFSFVLVGIAAGVGILALLLGDGRWVYTLVAVLAVGLVLWHNADDQNKQHQAVIDRNRPLQQECIADVNARAGALAQQAYAAGKLTQTYAIQLNQAKQQATTNCEFKYPTF